MSNNPYAAPSAVVSEVLSEGADRERIRKIARGQKMMVWAVLGQIAGNVISGSTPSLSALAIGVLITLACWVLAITGGVRLSKALGDHTVTNVIVAILMIVPLLNLITMLVLSNRATRALRKAGVRVGFMGASVD